MATRNIKIKKDITIIELNEFSDELLQFAVETLDLPNLKSFLQAGRYKYQTGDMYDSGYLEPWVQWVSIHTGVPSHIHGVKHLGSIPALKHPQVWEILTEKGITSGVWGCMNADRRAAERNCFFMPDPWVYASEPYPAALNDLAALPKYLAKNYQDFSIFSILRGAVKFIKGLIGIGMFLPFILEIASVSLIFLKYRLKHYVYICWYEGFSVRIFSALKKRYRPRVSFLFINLLAHLQHHYWLEKKSISSEIHYGLKKIDNMIGSLLKEFPEDIFIIHSGLTQINTNHEVPWILYRQKNPEWFFSCFGIHYSRVEQNMTHDGHMIFDKESNLNSAKKILEGMEIKNKKLFLIEMDKHDPRVIFFRLDFTEPVSDDQLFYSNKIPYKFHDYFDSIVRRTGKHVPYGYIYSQDIEFQDNMMNHEFNHYLFRYLNQ